MRVLVCGDRNWDDRYTIDTLLSDLVEVDPDVVIIEGGARGADRLAGRFADVEGVKHERFPPDWKRYRRGAGPKRNQAMLDSGVDLVLAFHDDLASSRGTADMVRRAQKAGVDVWVLGHVSE